MNDLLALVAARGDLAHIALFLWASAMSTLLWYALRDRL